MSRFRGDHAQANGLLIPRLIGGKWLYSAPSAKGKGHFSDLHSRAFTRQKIRGTKARPAEAARPTTDRPTVRRPHGRRRAPQESSSLLSIVVNFLKLSYLVEKIPLHTTPPIALHPAIDLPPSGDPARAHIAVRHSARNCRATSSPSAGRSALPLPAFLAYSVRSIVGTSQP